ncbi:hypothetical protein LV84_03853 [Algoriphagus ratkowskyi]|uniref:Uncharacterized protein n=1 Tax=Algoriphagus ratkowskyi TaxID=57028 RepID=A0A2W7RKA0_9BACT|nr:hypothetical protein [Algoriphagus ratkowskyi]PZX51095.1 hypothetical protein LV84_03853 [Algoriphagus ratkowskyi]TXD75883.1 hypothetical protein ESW18_18885 [Algoriphagus ratkowskyi]
MLLKANFIRKKHTFFFSMALIALIGSIIGFGKTFFYPLLAGTFSAPIVIHLHGGLAFLWILFFVMQSFLIRKGNLKLHKNLGFGGIALAILLSLSMAPAILHQVTKGLENGLGDLAFSDIPGTFTTTLIFMSLVLAGIRLRRKSEIHKRLLLLATLVLIWPAWFRFRHYFPSVSFPEIWFAIVLSDSFILLAILRDKIVLGKIHPVYWLGVAIIIEHWIEYFLYTTIFWNDLGKWLYRFL